MRKIALLAVVALAAACGDSSTPGNGYIRVANLAPGVPSIDFCVAPSGGTYSSPVMNAAGSAGGLIYDIPASSQTAGLQQVSKYFAYGAGSYDSKVKLNAPGGSCDSPIATLTNVSVAEGAYKMLVLVGSTETGTAAPLRLVAFTDETTVASTSVAIRFINAGLLQPAPYSAGIALDIGILAGTVYTKIFDNIAYPSTATPLVGGVDANGFAIIPAGGLPPGALELTVCAHGVTPPNPLACQSATVPAGQITGGIVATAFVAGIAPSPAGALFCGDSLNGVIQAFGNYSACTSSLSPD